MQSGKLEQMSYLKLGGLDCQGLEQIEREAFCFCRLFAFRFTVPLVCSYCLFSFLPFIGLSPALCIPPALPVFSRPS